MSQLRTKRRNAPRNEGPRAVVKYFEHPPVRENKRDREIERKAHITMDFTGTNGIGRALINFKTSTIFQKKSKRGWAAQRRRAPFKEYFAGDTEKLHKARMRHSWYRKKIALEAAS